MRKALMVVAAFVLCAAPVFAGQITLGASPNKSLTFTGKLSGFNLAIGPNLLQGTAFGFSSTQTGKYSILQNGATISSGLSCGSNCFMLNQTGNLLFNYGSTYTNGSLLSGNLQFVDIAQTPSSQTGIFNDMLVINLAVTGGSLQNQFTGGQGKLQLTIHFLTTQTLASLGIGKNLFANVSTGSVVPANPALPEPASLLTLGGSLFVCFVVITRKRLVVW